MSYKTITTAEEGWFFVQTDHKQIEENNGLIIIMRVAAWALTEDGEIYGLVGVSDTVLGPQASKVITQLHAPNRLANGQYKHINDFDLKQLKCLASIHPNAVPSALLEKI